MQIRNGILLKWDSYVHKFGSSFYVSLPQAWIKTRHVQKGDVLFFNLNPDGSITLSVQEPGVENGQH